MTITALIRAVLEAIIAYYRYRQESLIYDLIATSEKRMLELRRQIELLRDKRTEAATQAADQLSELYQREKLKYEKYLTSL